MKVRCWWWRWSRQTTVRTTNKWPHQQETFLVVSSQCISVLLSNLIDIFIFYWSRSSFLFYWMSESVLHLFHAENNSENDNRWWSTGPMALQDLHLCSILIWIIQVKAKRKSFKYTLHLNYIEVNNVISDNNKFVFYSLVVFIECPSWEHL